MRIMQISNSHQDYLELFRKRFKKIRSYDARMQAYIDDYYWASHTMTPALERLGHETFFCVPTETESQRIWCEENNAPWHEEAPIMACFEQVARFQPDVLYIGSASMYHDAFLQHLPYRPKLVVGWHATLTWAHMRLSHYDLILSSHDHCMGIAQHQGAPRVTYFYPGFPAELQNAFSPRKHTDLCFSGYWAISHPRRNEILHQLAERLPKLNMECAYHLGFYNGGPACPDVVQKLNRGPVWGRSMIKAFAASHITLNAYCNLNDGPQTLSPNMRQLEGTGAGSLLLTEESPNIDAFFTPDMDIVTFTHVDELVEKAQHYLQNKEALQKIAAQGQATCLQHYNMDVRAQAFMDRVEEHLQNQPPLPVDTCIRTLNALAAGCRANADMLTSPDMQALLNNALTLGLQLWGTGRNEQALQLLNAVEQLPLGIIKNFCLNKALRYIRQNDIIEAEKLLRQELNSYPENDSARQQLSELTIHKHTTHSL